MGPVRRREQGVVMFVTVLLLVLMGALGLAALDAASRDRDAAGYYNRENAAFYAAEAGVSHARALIRGVGSTDELPAFPTQGAPQTLGDTSMYPAGGGSPLPFYYGDPAVPNPLPFGYAPLAIDLMDQAPSAAKDFALTVRVLDTGGFGSTTDVWAIPH